MTEFFLLGCLGKFGVSSQGIWAKSLNIWTQQSTFVRRVHWRLLFGYHKTRHPTHRHVTLADFKAQTTPSWGYRVITFEYLNEWTWTFPLFLHLLPYQSNLQIIKNPQTTFHSTRSCIFESASLTKLWIYLLLT